MPICPSVLTRYICCIHWFTHFAYDFIVPEMLFTPFKLKNGNIKRSRFSFIRSVFLSWYLGSFYCRQYLQLNLRINNFSNYFDLDYGIQTSQIQGSNGWKKYYTAIGGHYYGEAKLKQQKIDQIIN